MSLAVCLLKDTPHYRRTIFEAGLRAVGLDIGPLPERWRPGDVLVIWNRCRGLHSTALHAEEGGAAVIVAENGYIGRDPQGRKLYALALSHHNGAGRWPAGDPERWAALGIALKPWRADGDHIVMLPQRGIGAPNVAMPKTWPAETYAWLRGSTKRPVRMREHPGSGPPKTPLEEDLRGAWCAVTWGSGAGIKALVAGIPVFHALPAWIGAGAARPLCDDLESPALGDRLPMLERLAWAQWGCDEIASGEAFGRLLALHAERAG